MLGDLAARDSTIKFWDLAKIDRGFGFKAAFWKHLMQMFYLII